MNSESTLGRFVQRHALLRIPVAVFTRTTELNGNYAANALTLVGFISLFPLLLLIISVAGLFGGPDSHLVDRIVNFVGLSADATRTVTDTLKQAQSSGTTGSIVGVIGLAWSGLSLVAAMRYAVNLPQGHAIKGLHARLTGIPWLIGAGAIFVASFVLSAILDWLPVWSAPLVVLGSFGIDVTLFSWTFWFLAFERPTWRAFLPGALAAAIGFTALKIGATMILPRLVTSSSATYGGLGTVFAILAWLLIFSRVFVYSVVFNAVWADERSLAATTDGADTSVDPSGSELGDPPEDP